MAVDLGFTKSLGMRRIYKMVEDGLTDLDEILKERITSLKLDRDGAKAALERIRSRSTASKIDPKLIERFERAMRENITTDGIPFRKTRQLLNYLNNCIISFHLSAML